MIFSVPAISSSTKGIPAAVQTSTQLVETFATNLNLTVNPTGVNNLVVVHINVRKPGASPTGVTDNMGNTYVLGSPIIFHTTSDEGYQAYGVQITGGVTTITVNGSGGMYIAAGADEYSGVKTTNDTVFDVSTTGSGSGTTLSVSTLTPSSKGELIVATMATRSSPVTYTAGTNYTLYNGTNNQVRSQYRLVGASTETAPCTINISNSWGEIVRAYKPR